jgi:FkbM family methyltransferase
MPVNLSRLIELYRYFPSGVATAMALSEGTRALLNRNGRPSYSQTGEDIVASAYLDLTRPGFYVDVGCFDPFQFSNTLALYSRGWRGLVVDGNPAAIRRFQRCRPRDTAVCAICSNVEGPVTFAVSRHPEMSTISRDFETSRINPADVEQRVQHEAVRLQTLLERHDVPRRFELLSIDVEGHDYEVLTSFDIEAFRPRVVIVEMHGYRLPGEGDHPIVHYLEEHGYRLASYTVMNGIFTDTRV